MRRMKLKPHQTIRGGQERATAPTPTSLPLQTSPDAPSRLKTVARTRPSKVLRVCQAARATPNMIQLPVTDMCRHENPISTVDQQHGSPGSSVGVFFFLSFFSSGAPNAFTASMEHWQSRVRAGPIRRSGCGKFWAGRLGYAGVSVAEHGKQCGGAV